MLKDNAKRLMPLHGLAVLAFMLMLAACGAAQEPEVPVTEAMPSETPPPATETIAAPTATVQLTPAGPNELVIWWPEPLAPLDNETAAEVLSEQLTAFQRDQANVVVDFRLKRVEETGGIMSTLRTANAVAPGALPDLTLLRREDLLIAAQAGLIQPLSGQLSPAILEDMQESSLDLGRFGGELYGIPYMLEVLHIAYPPDTPDMNDWRFDAVLEKEIPFLFPAGRSNGINQALLVQYMAAGGELGQPGSQTINAEALQTTLAFYEAAAEAGIINSSVLEYTHPRDYLEVLNAGDPIAVLVTSTLYRQLADEGLELGFGPIPTATGMPVTLVDGWMWVLTTQDADRQARALRFLDWMLDADRQAEYADVLHVLPSQRMAMRQMDNPQYSAFVAELLANAILPQGEAESGTAARAIQNALSEVLTRQTTAEEATEELVAEFE